MTAELFLLIAAGAIVGGFVNGLAGFGTTLFSLGFWLFVLPPQQAVAVALVMALATGVFGLWEVRRTMIGQGRRLFRFLLPALFGIPVGVLCLAYVNGEVLRLTIAGLMVTYGVFFIIRRHLPMLDHPPSWIEPGIGFTGGILGGLAGLSGVLPAMWCALRPWTKAETRAVLQPFNVAVLAISAGVLYWRRAYDRETLIILGAAVAVAAIGTMGGIWTFRRVSDAQFRLMLVGLMVTSGLILGAVTLLI